MGWSENWPRLLVAAIALLVLARLSEGKLKLRTSEGPVEVMLNENGLLHCEIDNLTGITLSPNNLGILWVFIQGTEKNNIFTYSNGEITTLWKEAELSENSILNGDMSLLVKNVTFIHSGEYQCEVFIPPNEKHSLTINLEVLARPTVTVVSESIVEVGTGGEMVLRCQLNGYYPCESNVEWIQSNPSQEEPKLLTDICITPPIKNPDRTCNVTAEVSLEPRVEDIGSSFQCCVTHKTFPVPHIVKAEVTLKEAEIRLSIQSIVGSIFGSIIIFVALTATGIFIYMRYFYKVPPKVSDIQLPARIVHQEQADIICHVAGFRPGDIVVGWYLKRHDDSTEKLIHEYKRTFLVPMFGRQNGPSERSATKDHWNVLTSFQTCDDGAHSFSSTLEVIPDIMTDHNAQIIFKVSHQAGSEEKRILLPVHGIAPKLGEIIRPPVVHHNRSLTLTCPIKIFKPNLLTIKWYERINELKSLLLDYKTGDEINRTVGRYSHYVNEFSCDNHTYSVYSVLLFKATIQEDDGKEYLCEVNHSILEYLAEEQVKLEVKAFPSLDTILCEPVNPKIEKELTLSCKVHSFYPKNITVQWLKDEELLNDVKTSKIVENPNDNLYELTTTCTIIPTLSDVQSKYQCRVNHKSLRCPKFVEYIPENLASSPKINEITCDPVSPEIGKELTFTCEIKEFYPEDIQIDWFRDDERINKNTNLGIISETLSNEHGLYHKITKLTLTPSTDDQQAEYRVEVCHSKSSANLLKQSVQLFLKGSPKFSDFKMEPKVPLYGYSLSVSSSVHDILNKNITVQWYKGSKLVKSGVMNSDLVHTHENTYKIESCLQFLVTAEDFKRELIFLYKDNSKREEFRRRIQLPLKAVPPKVSEIKCSPVHPKIGENATLTCRIAEFSPMDIHVLWSKGCKVYKDKVIEEMPKIDETGLYSTITRLPIVISEDSEEYVCEITHVKTNDIIEKRFNLQI